MQSLYEIRYRNLKRFRQEYPTLRAFAKKIDKDPNLLSRILLDNPEKRKNIGHTLASDIEAKLGLEEFSLSKEFVNPFSIVDTLKVVYIKYLSYEQPTGEALMYEDDKTCPMNVDLFEKANVDSGKAALFVPMDDAMSPDLEPGESALIDLNAQEVTSGYMYAIKMDQKLLVRRLFTMPNDGLRIVCDNLNKKKMLPDEYVSLSKDADRFMIVGKVFYIGKLIA